MIKTKDATFLSEITEDAIKVSDHNLWEIKFNKCTGAIESWTVIDVNGFFKLATVLFILLISHDNRNVFYTLHFNIVGLEA